MVDITKCEGGNCPLKESCLRYTSAGDEYHSYHASYTGERNCEDFINNKRENTK